MTTIFKTAVVTGAAQGIGRAIAERLLKDNWRVILIDHRLPALRSTANQIPNRNSVLILRADVSQDSDIRRAMAQAIKKWGRLDALINNAAISQPLSGFDVKRWKETLAVNLTGPFLCAKYAAAALKKNKGAIINIASTRALMSEPHTQAYSASKGGLVALTHSLALSLGPDVRVNCISPGWIHTVTSSLRDQDHRQHPVGRVGRPEDVAAMVSYLISPEAGFITGQNFVIDGGMTKKMIYTD